MSSLPLSAFPLSPSLRSLLSAHGFTRSEQISCLSPSQLARELSLPLSECVSLLRSLRSVPDVVGVTTVDGGVAAPQPANGNVSAARGPSSSPIPASSYSASITAPQLAASLFTSPAAAPCPPPERPWSALAGYAAAGVSFCPPSALSLHSSSSSSVLSSSLSSSSQAVAVSGARSIFTLCQKLDWLLGDGVRLSELTEFCGVPGVGKSQLGIQLAMDVGIPPYLGGVDGESVYIDSEGSFMPQRAKEIAEGLAGHIANLTRRKGQGGGGSSAATSERPPLTAETLMRGVHVFRVFDYVEQLAVIAYLPAFIANHPRVRLVVLDSVAFHFRRGFDDFSVRSRLLAAMAQQLIALARERQLAVVAVNQLTTRIAGGERADRGSSGGGGGGSDVSSLAPALGESWSHACTNRVLLYWKGRERWARIIKSPSRKQAACRYDIRQSGIRDSSSSSNSSGSHTGKRSGEALAATDTDKRSRVDEQQAAVEQSDGRSL